jgi:hypothetical protein
VDVSACTFYLVFKEPGLRFGWTTEAERSLQVFLLQGNLPILLEVSNHCQSPARTFFGFAAPSLQTGAALIRALNGRRQTAEGLTESEGLSVAEKKFARSSEQIIRLNSPGHAP